MKHQIEARYPATIHHDKSVLYSVSKEIQKEITTREKGTNIKDLLIIKVCALLQGTNIKV